ncbi:hypothetical protein O5707_28550 [Escherichia coli]|nr:hypothetical protein [Escherichia coli]
MTLSPCFWLSLLRPSSALWLPGGIRSSGPDSDRQLLAHPPVSAELRWRGFGPRRYGPMRENPGLVASDRSGRCPVAP